MYPPPDELAARLKLTFGIGYLTLTGVTQSVALAVLAARVESTFEQFGCQLGADLHDLPAHRARLERVPDRVDRLRLDTDAGRRPDPVQPAGAAIFVAHNVYPNERMWLVAMSAFLAMGCAAFAHGFIQAGRHVTENRDVLRAIGGHQSLTMAFTGGGCLLCLGAVLLYEPLGLDDADVVVAFVALAVVVATMLRSIPYWHRITRYAATADAG